MNEKLLKVLEFNEILARVSRFAVSERAKRAVLSITPLGDKTEIEKSLSLTSQAYTVKSKYLVNPIVQFDDITEILEKARANAVLRPDELLKVARVLRSARIAKSELNGLGDDVSDLKNITGPIILDRNIENMIGDAIASENEIKDDASSTLRDIRRKIYSANARLKEKLASYTRTSGISQYLQDNIVTVRMGRFVLPVKSESRSMVPGLIHDRSASGSTVFIEPFPVVELNNELRYLQTEEQNEIERILSVLSEATANSYDILTVAQDRCTDLDVIFAKSEYAVSYKGTVPILNDKGAISLIDARHPLIDPIKVVPVNIATGDGYDIIVITGPNTGGKTVCLKTVGLCCLMAYSGIPIPCGEGSVVSVFDEIFCDLGDEQSIEQSLSTFSAHIVNIVRITDSVTKKSLVLLDELGAGTDPTEGAALSLGIIKYLECVGCKGIITTHFNELKEYALVSNKLVNACMQFDEQTLKPTYKLTIGIPGVSNALKIAGTLGLNSYILKAAKDSISEDDAKFETVLREAQNTKMQVEREREVIERERAELYAERDRIEDVRKKTEEKYERIQNNAKAEASRIIGNMVEKANELIEELKERIKEGDEDALRKARNLRSQIENIKSDTEEVIMPLYEKFVPQNAKLGQRVIVLSLRGEGELISLRDKKGNYGVRVGNARLNVKEDDLGLPVKKERKIARAPRPSVVVSAAAPTQSQTEIKILGLTVSEAIEVVEPAILAAESGSMLRIVHGKGTGALGKGIQKYLKSCPRIVSFRYGRYGEGDTGVTIAEIK